MDYYHIGVDVGTGSARVGVFSNTGQLLETRSKEIKINNPSSGFYEQSSEDIWNAVKEIVKEATKSYDKSKILDLSFCATCSLVAVGPLGTPVSISEGGDPSWDIIMWMDHRACEEALKINLTSHKVLDFVGGKISLEMQTPKLLWLKNHLRDECYDKTKEFFDLPDFLRWKATGSLKRSICSIVCKWTHINAPSGNHWDSSYLREIGLGDVEGKIGSTFAFQNCDDMLSAEAAEELGLDPKVKVGYSLIDAHSGVLGMVGAKEGRSGGVVDITRRLALICGTSNCHMALSKKPCNVPGVWGPYYGVIFPNLYLNEGGQSAAGKLLDHIVSTHAAYPKLFKELGGNHGKLLSHLEYILEGEKDPTLLTKDVHIWPDFHGNRSPLADPSLKGSMCGLTLSDSEKDLAIIYLSTIQALGYGSRHIVEELKKGGHEEFESVVICGGLAKSKLFLQTHADILKLPVLVPNCAEPVLLGAAMSAANAGNSQGLDSVMKRMAGEAGIIQPNPKYFGYHEKKYKVFLEMVNDQIKYKKIME